MAKTERTVSTDISNSTLFESEYHLITRSYFECLLIRVLNTAHTNKSYF